LNHYIKSISRKIFNKIGYEIIPAKDINFGYIPALETIAAAKKDNLSICEYVELLWDQKGCTENVIKQMESNGCFEKSTNVLEIGPGTGRYLELIINQVNPDNYEIYEIAADWEEYLVKKYGTKITSHIADGKSLAFTQNSSCDLVHAHGIFVYLKFLHVFEYLSEMVRVCTPGGFIVFDFYSEKEFDKNQIKKWLITKDRYAVVINYSTVVDFFQQYGFELIDEFPNKYGHGFSRYFILKNTGNK